METKRSYFYKRILAFSYAFKGIAYFLKREAHAKIHLSAIILVVISGIVFKIKVNEWIAIILCMGLVLAAEAINSAIELLTDSIYKDYNPIAGHIKDIAAGAVLICAIVAAVVGCIIFVPHILILF